jgi:hypothetical protein
MKDLPAVMETPAGLDEAAALASLSARPPPGG